MSLSLDSFDVSHCHTTRGAITKCSELEECHIVAFDVLLDFLDPKAAVPFGCRRLLAARVPIPETLMYEDRSVGLRDQSVRSPRHVFDVGFRCNTQRSKRCPYRELGGCARLSNGTHLLACQLVCLLRQFSQGMTLALGPCSCSQVQS